MLLNRRQFLGASLAGIAAPSFGGLSLSLAHAAPSWSEGETILVVVQLAGGNDGLNTVIPSSNDIYQRSRPTIRFGKKDVLRLNDTLGFHPRMPGFHKLYETGKLAILQGVGHAHSSRDHGVAIRDWETALPKKPACQTGWLGRVMDEHPNLKTEPAIYLSSHGIPFALRARTNVARRFTSLDAVTLHNPVAEKKNNNARQRLLPVVRDSRPNSANPLLATAYNSLSLALTWQERLEALGTSNVSYPSHELGRALQNAAQLIRGEVGCRLYWVDHSGGGFGAYDNHANQLGNHCALLDQLSTGVEAFVTDLQRDRLLDRVLLVTVSEFGRNVTENGRRGTDHGAAAPMFLVGGKVKPGLHGKHPSLSDLEQDALKPTVDFRSYFATLLECWLRIDSQPILNSKYATVDLVM